MHSNIPCTRVRLDASALFLVRIGGSRSSTHPSMKVFDSSRCGEERIRGGSCLPILLSEHPGCPVSPSGLFRVNDPTALSTIEHAARLPRVGPSSSNRGFTNNTLKSFPSKNAFPLRRMSCFLVFLLERHCRDFRRSDHLDLGELVIQPAHPAVGHGRCDQASWFATRPHLSAQFCPARITPLQAVRGFNQHCPQLRIACSDQ